MNNRLSIIFMLILTASSGLYAENISLNALIQKAKDKNPEIIAARNNWNAEKVRVLPERTWESPGFFIDSQNMPVDEFNLGKANETMYGIEQMVPFPGKLAIKGKIAALDAERAMWDFRETEFKVIAQLKAAYSKYFYINKAIDIYNDNLELMKNFAAVAETKYISGKTSQGEVLRAQVETSKMYNMIITLQQEKELAEAELNALIGNDPDEKIQIPEELTLSYIKKGWDEIRNIIINNNPQLKKENIGILTGRWLNRYAKTGFLPDFNLTYRKRRMSGSWSGQDLMVGFTLPLWFWKPAFNIKESAYGLKASLAGQKNMELMTVYAGKELFIKLQTLERQLELYKTTFLPQAEQAFKVIEVSYRSGKEDFLMLLDSERALLDFQIDDYKSFSEYYQNLAELERISGVELK